MNSDPSTNHGPQNCLFHPHPIGIPLASAGGDLLNPRVPGGLRPAEEVFRRTAGALRVPWAEEIRLDRLDPGESQVTYPAW